MTALRASRLWSRSGSLRTGLIGSEGAIFCLLGIWAFAPLAALVIYVHRHGGVLTGANGSDAFDQAAYLAWIRDSGSHLLASDLWQLGPTPHDYLHPMFFLSGLLWRLGVSVQVAYLAWKPIALVVLFGGFTAYVRRAVEGRWHQAAALLLALFYVSPVLALATWTGHLTPAHRFDLLLVTDDPDSALNLWGFDHTAIAIGLMPVFLLAVERVLDSSRRLARGATPSTAGTRSSAAAALAGMVVSWLHPWQGVILLAILGALVVVSPPRRRHTALVIPALGTALPLLYGFVLSHTDAVWRDFQARTIGTGTAPWWALLVSFGPLAALAAVELVKRRPANDREWMLVLWVPACAAVYFLLPEFPPHALSGVTLPLAVLAVGGWRRLQAPRLPSAALGAGLVLAFTVPAVVYHAQATAHDLGNSVSGAAARQLEVLNDDQAAALRSIASSPRSGGVLAPWFLSMSVPGLTGHAAYAGHGMWQPPGNVSAASDFFSPATTASRRRSILRESRARFVVVDCGGPSNLGRDISSLVHSTRRFGCVTVYEL